MRPTSALPLVLLHKPCPDLGSLAESANVTGEFEIVGHPSTGRIAGRYAVHKANGKSAILEETEGSACSMRSGWRRIP
ncbi:MAG TPA: hypothetical protein VKA06_06315 [Spirochaetia bacterium]|nr:hypothetical protein [Spirochaetia bacterium]